jgi:hypothetical protein
MSGLSTVEISEVTRPEPEGLFSLGFWLECEREAARILRTMTDVDDERVGRDATAPRASRSRATMPVTASSSFSVSEGGQVHVTPPSRPGRSRGLPRHPRRGR